MRKLKTNLNNREHSVGFKTIHYSSRPARNTVSGTAKGPDGDILRLNT